MEPTSEQASPREHVIVEDDSLTQVLAYVERGWGVLPLHTITNLDRCTCRKPDCASPAKHPIRWLVPHGVHDATADPDTIEAWWEAAPWANIGIACGAGVVVLDVDPGRGGAESFARAIRDHGELPAGPRVESGSRGAHYYFAGDAALATRKDWLPGLELKAAGSYVVAPPSRHRSGRTYRWLVPLDAAPLPALPAWIPRDPAPASPSPLRITPNNREPAPLPANFETLLRDNPEIRGRWRNPLWEGYGYHPLSEACCGILYRFRRFGSGSYGENDLMEVARRFYADQNRVKSPSSLRSIVAASGRFLE